jgi:hypothetical protein
VTGPLLRTALVAAALAVAGAGALAAQAGRVPAPAATPAADPLRLHAFSLEHQRAEEALPLVQPLLSNRGSVELQAATNTLVVRDSLSALVRVTAALRAFDHPSRAVAFDVQLVRAGLSGISPQPPASPLEPGLQLRLERLFRYQGYRLLARARLDTREGEEIAYEMAGGYRVSFRLGTMVGERRIKLSGFRIARREAGNQESELVHTAVNLWRSQPFVLALSRDEGSPSALLVVLTFLPEAEGR